MTTATHTQTPPSDTDAGCGPDCVLIDGECRCYFGESVTEPMPAWLEDIVLAY